MAKDSGLSPNQQRAWEKLRALRAKRGPQPDDWRGKAIRDNLSEVIKVSTKLHEEFGWGTGEGAAEKKKELRRYLGDYYTKYIMEKATPDEIDAILSDLQSTTLSAIKKDSRKDAKKKVQPRFEYPEPDKKTELAAIEQHSSELAHVSRSVGELGLPGADVQMLIKGLHELSGRCEELARSLGMHAIAEGNLTQRALSQLVGVHELTVHRWVKAAQAQTAPIEQEEQ